MILKADATFSIFEMTFRSVEFTQVCCQLIHHTPLTNEYLAFLEANVHCIAQVNNSFNDHLRYSKAILLKVVESEMLLNSKLFPLLKLIASLLS
jgi:hypothetical protein